MATDIIIIGSGPLGAICAKNLAERGLTVLMLEAGEAISSPPGEHLRNQQCYQDNPDGFFTEINKWCQTYDDQVPPEQLPGANITQAFGGQGLLWTNNCPRPQQHERWSVFNDQEWDNLLTRAEENLFVSETLFDDSIRQQKVIEKLAAPLASMQRAISKNPTAAKRLGNGNIQFTATKEILDVPPDISKRIRIACKTKVLELITHKDQVKAVKIQQGGKISELCADHIIIAAGAFDTTQLLFDSHIRPPALGRYLHFHPLFIAQCVLNKEFCARDDVVDIPPRTCIYPTPNYPWHSMILRDLFFDISSEPAPQNKLIEMQFFIPIAVRENNRMILSNKTPSFDVHLTENDKRTLENAKQDLNDIAQILGRFRKDCEPFLVDFGFTHPMGMCRMGEDPQTSVADNHGRVHGFANLFLATVGLIPKSIAVNPTLTAAALAIASCDYLVSH